MYQQEHFTVKLIFCSKLIYSKENAANFLNNIYTTSHLKTNDNFYIGLERWLQ